jgi:hypothetical protein
MEGVEEVKKKGRGRPRKAAEDVKKSRTVMFSDKEWVMVTEQAREEGKEVSTFVNEEMMKVVKARRRRRMGYGLG